MPFIADGAGRGKRKRKREEGEGRGRGKRKREREAGRGRGRGKREEGRGRGKREEGRGKREQEQEQEQEQGTGAGTGTGTGTGTGAGAGAGTGNRNRNREQEQEQEQEQFIHRHRSSSSFIVIAHRHRSSSSFIVIVIVHRHRHRSSSSFIVIVHRHRHRSSFIVIVIVHEFLSLDSYSPRTLCVVGSAPITARDPRQPRCPRFWLRRLTDHSWLSRISRWEVGMNPQRTTSSFLALDRALDLVRALRPLANRLDRHDRALAKQLRAAASSVPLNLAEGRGRRKGDRLHHWRIAAGSAREVQACLLTAEAWGYLECDELAPSMDALDQVLAICWRLTH